MRSRGFTMLEVLAVMLLTGIVMGIALNYYVTLSRGSTRAAQHTREMRLATALLDRVARDFEGTLLVRKPDAVDPLEHPWIFLGESRTSPVGADHVKFVTRNHRPRGSQTHESDLAVVSYTLRRGEGDGYELMRHSSPRLPEGLDRDFPSAQDEDAVLLADGLASFGIRFVDDAGEVTDSWDSSQLARSSSLPTAVELEVALLEGQAVESEPGLGGLDEPEGFVRRVLLPLRPLDLEELLGEEGESDPDEDDDSDSDADGLTWADCIDGSAIDTGGSLGGAGLAILTSDQPFDLSAVPPDLAFAVKPECR